MGSGEKLRGRRRKIGRRRRRIGFRRRRRVGPRRRGRYRRGGGGGLGILIGKLCGLCIGAIVSSIADYKKNVDKLKAEQDEILKEKAERKEQGKEDAEADEEEAENIKELQEAQTELLNDILERQAREKDPERLQQLFEQQNELIAQMNQLQTAGFKYDNEIPAPKETTQTTTQATTQNEGGEVPQAATY